MHFFKPSMDPWAMLAIAAKLNLLKNTFLNVSFQ